MLNRYVGASRDVAVGVGAGANVSSEGRPDPFRCSRCQSKEQVGGNLALGVAAMTLSPIR
jgi:hypothetical protein